MSNKINIIFLNDIYLICLYCTVGITMYTYNIMHIIRPEMLHHIKRIQVFNLINNTY